MSDVFWALLVAAVFLIGYRQNRRYARVILAQHKNFHDLLRVAEAQKRIIDILLNFNTIEPPQPK